MATYDVPGYRAANQDKLHVGCWAEHADGSLMLIAKLDAGRVGYALRSANGAVFRGELPEGAFARLFSNGADHFQWLWHDKSPAPVGKFTAPALPAPKQDFVRAAEKLAQEFSLEARGLSEEETEALLEA